MIQSKIIAPPLPSPFVRRPRIEQLLAGLIENYQLVWVCGMAGAGKTTALVETSGLVGRPVAWLTTDESDVAPGRLLTYLEAALAARVPSAAGVASSALAAGLAHREAAGLLAEAVGDAPVLLVLDELERVAEAPEALSVLGGLVRYAPDTMRIVLASRSELSLDLGSMFVGRVATLRDPELALTAEEAAQALAEAGAGDVDAGQVVELTRGWVTGVLFEAWRTGGRTATVRGDDDPLHGYLSSQILDRLSPEERSFLIDTSVLDVVTAERAEALGQPEAAARLEKLRAKHLPVVWNARGDAVRFHPRFREYLFECLGRQGQERVRAARIAHARLLCEEGHDEEAVDEFLRAGLPEEALEPAVGVIELVGERTDVAVVERWLAALADVRPVWSPGLTTAELMLALARDDYRAGVRIADRLSRLGARGELARASSRAASLMAWFYIHAGRAEDARAVLDPARPSPEIDAMRYALTQTQEHIPEAELMVPLTGGPLDALVLRVHYYRGRLELLADEPASPWAARLAEPWRIGALAALGETEQALALYESARARDGAVWLRALLGPELLADLGRTDDAWAELRAGRELIRASGSLVLEWLSHVLEAKLQLRLRRDPEAARAALAKIEANPAAAEFRFLLEQVDTWLGLALLLEGNDAGALARLQRAVRSMVAANRILLLPAAAVYLAEASARAGDGEGEGRAADLALQTATEQGSNHLLLQALADVPAVLSRRLAAGAGPDSPWSQLAETLAAGTAMDPSRAR